MNEFGTPTMDCYSAKKVESALMKLLVSDLNLGIEGLGNAEKV